MWTSRPTTWTVSSVANETTVAPSAPVATSRADAAGAGSGHGMRCGGGGDGLEQSLAALPGVAQVEATQGELSGEFTLTLEVGADADRVAQLATGVVVDSGAQLYQLQQLTRGLDTVFRETTGNSAEVHDNGG